MRGTHYTHQTKRQVEKWRSEGKTYGEITKKFGVPKSTLSNWLHANHEGMYSRERQLTHLEKARPLALAAVQRRITQQNKNIKDKVLTEMQTFPLSDIGLQKVILASLYWAEGAKHAKVSGLTFANTDPRMIELFTTLLRWCYLVDVHWFRICLHLHYYHRVEETKDFWSKLTHVPRSQFNKTYLKKRSKTKRFRKNFKGICFLKYSDSTIRKELLTIAEELHIRYRQT